MSYKPGLSRGLLAALLVSASLVAGCAVTRAEPPVSSLQSARQAIANAEESRASQDAPLELRQARDKLAAANEAVANDNMPEAKRLADEATILAELAYSRSEMMTAQKTNRELQKTTEMFKEELRRPRGETS